MSISEHHTRTRAIKQQPEPVMGALLGKKTDRGAEIIDSFELRYSHRSNDSSSTVVNTNSTIAINNSTPMDDTGLPPATSTTPTSHSTDLQIDITFFQKKLPLVKQVSGDLELVGWYSTTLFVGDDSSVKDVDISLHKQISELIPNPVYLKLNPYRRENDPKISGVLPLNVYEPVIEVDGSGEHLDLIEVSWTIVTEDVEIIGLEHNAKMTHTDVAPSAAIDNLRMQHSAVKMLKDRIKAISKFVKDVLAGTLPYHEEIMLDIARLCQRFPLMSSAQYAQAYNIKCNDVALNTYLGILTKGSMCKMHSGVQSLKTRAFPSTHARR